MKKVVPIFYESLPVLVMIGLIPLIVDDVVLSLVYAVLIIVLLTLRRTKHDLAVFAMGVVFMTISEMFFISTGVETFTRDSFLGLMPLWLPLLWGYGFVVIKRSVVLLQAR